MATDPVPYPPADIAAIYRVMHERRDMRHFTGEAVDPAQLLRLIEAAHLAPSVGFMQPWRFIRVADAALRRALYDHVNEERLATADALGQRGGEFMAIKVEGILSCAEILVVGLTDGRERYVFGRRTMPEMDLASASCAIQNMWLAARAEGLGLGWVSLFDPERLRQLCGMPDGSQPIAILCIGHVPAFYPAPLLETQGWDRRRTLESLVFTDAWGQAGPPAATSG